MASPLARSLCGASGNCLFKDGKDSFKAFRKSSTFIVFASPLNRGGGGGGA